MPWSLSSAITQMSVLSLRLVSGNLGSSGYRPSGGLLLEEEVKALRTQEWRCLGTRVALTRREPTGSCADLGDTGSSEEEHMPLPDTAPIPAPQLTSCDFWV